MTRNASKSKQVHRLGNGITQVAVRRLYERFLDLVLGLPGAMRVQATSVEARIFFGEAFLCRIVPYRELFHVQVGEGPNWETRVRNESGMIESIDRVLHHYLTICSESQPVDRPA